MSRYLLLSIPLITAFMVGCTSTSHIPRSGVAPGFVIANVNYPSYRETDTEFKISRNDIVILGPVKASGNSINVLGIVATGDNGYGNLTKAARSAYPEADGVVDIQWDTSYENLCIPACYCLIPIYMTTKTAIEGNAFKFKPDIFSKTVPVAASSKSP